MDKRWRGLIAGLVLLAACEQQATPLPVNLEPPASATPTEAAPLPLRYALAPNAAAVLPDADKNQIAASAELITLDAPPIPADLGAAYEIVVALGDLPDGTHAPTPLQVFLVMDTTLPPLDDPALADLVRRAINPPQIAASLNLPGNQIAPSTPSDPAALRTELANAGYPDGFDLTLRADFAPGGQALAQMLAAVGIDVRLAANAAEPAQLTLTTQPQPGATPLLTIPISYRAVDGLTITFTPAGFPVAQR